MDENEVDVCKVFGSWCAGLSGFCRAVSVMSALCHGVRCMSVLSGCVSVMSGCTSAESAIIRRVSSEHWAPHAPSHAPRYRLPCKPRYATRNVLMARRTRPTPVPMCGCSVIG